MSSNVSSSAITSVSYPTFDDKCSFLDEFQKRFQQPLAQYFQQDWVKSFTSEQKSQSEKENLEWNRKTFNRKSFNIYVKGTYTIFE